MIDVSCAIILKGNKILMAQNLSTSDHPLQWEFPGGKIKQGETPEECIVREIREELSLKISIIKKMVPVKYDYGFKAIRLIPFLCEIKRGTLRLNDHEAIKWIRPAELQKLDLAAADKVLIEHSQNAAFLKEYIGE